METVKRLCPKCRGQAKFMGMGCIMEDCEHCDKTGWKEVPVEIVVKKKKEAKVIFEDIQEPILEKTLNRSENDPLYKKEESIKDGTSITQTD